MQRIASGDVIADILEPHLELIQCLDDIFTFLKIYKKDSKEVNHYTNDDLDQFENLMILFMNLWRGSSLNLSVKMLKLHLLVAHVWPFILENKFSPCRVSEQDLESCHSQFKKMFKDFNNDKKRLLSFMKTYNALHF